MSKSITFKRHHALESALHLFWFRGFSAASLRQLEEVTELNPGSIYYHFTNKEQLFLSVIQHYIDHHLYTRIKKHLYSGSPLEGLRRFMTSGYRNNQDYQYRNSCFLTYACSDIRLLPATTPELINQGLDHILNGLKYQIEQAIKKNLISTSQPSHELAQELLNLYLSLQLLAQARPNQQQLDILVNHSLARLLPLQKK